MALPAILRAASSIKAGTDRFIVASKLNKIASNPLAGAIAEATGASRVPGLNKLGSYISKVKAPKEEKDKTTKSKPAKDKTTSDKNREKARDDAEKNKDRQDKAEKESKRDDESVSLLKIISQDTVRVRDAVETLLKKQDEKATGGKGLLGGIGAALTSLLPALLGGKGGGGLLRTLLRSGGALRSLSGSALRLGGTALGLGGAAAAGTAVASAAGRHALRDPTTGRFLPKAAAAPKGILARAGAMAGRVGATISGVASRAGGTVGRGIAKAGGKSLIKKIPVIGAIAGLGFAAKRAMAGDWTGAGMEASSGLAGTVPGVGTAASVGIDAALIARDLKRARQAGGAATAPTQTATAPPAVRAQTRAQPADKGIFLLPAQVVLNKMFDLMSDRSKGIYTIPAVRESRSTLSTPRHTPPSPSLPPPPSRSEGTSSIGPVTAGIGDVTSGQSMHAPASQGLGSLSAHYESGKRGSSAIGWDETGGTSYGKYQIASRTGTMKQFMSFLKDNNPEAYSRLAAAGDPDGGKSGTFAQAWKELAKDGTLGTSEHDFIKQSHYDVGFNKIKSEKLRSMVGKSSALQDVLWSTSVQHGGGGAGGIFNKVYKDGMTEQDLIKAVYDERATRFGRSTPKVRSSVQSRFADESRRALAAVGTSPTGMVRDSAVASAQTSRAPVVVQAPQIAMAPQGKGTNQRSVPSNTPLIVRNPDSPVRNNVNTWIRTT